MENIGHLTNELSVSMLPVNEIEAVLYTVKDVIPPSTPLGAGLAVLCAVLAFFKVLKRKPKR